VKGGGLAAHAPLATQITLIVSDTADGREADVASGPTLRASEEIPCRAVVDKYGLEGELPPRVVRALEEPGGARGLRPDAGGRRYSHVLLDNARAREAAARAAAEREAAERLATMERQRLEEHLADAQAEVEDLRDQLERAHARIADLEATLVVPRAPRVPRAPGPPRQPRRDRTEEHPTVPVRRNHASLRRSTARTAILLALTLLVIVIVVVVLQVRPL
jgi:hypothetical protein